MTPNFPTPTPEEWRQRVMAELGVESSAEREFERALVTRTLAGLDVAPLYTAEDVSALPGTAGAVSPRSGAFVIAPRVEHPSPRTANARLLEDLEGGATGTSIEWARPRDGDRDTRAPGVRLESLHDLDALLDGVYLDAVPIAFGTSGDGLTLASVFVALCRERNVDPARVAVHFGFDPFASLAADGGLPGDLDDARRELCTLAESSRLELDRARSLAVDAGVWHRAGGHAVLELGYALSAFVEALRWLEASGLPPAAAHSEFVWRFDVGRDTLTEISKLRAARVVHAKVLGSSGIAAGTPLVLHATTSRRSLARRDPWTNMLRTALGTVAATAGGADLVTTLPYDAALGDPSPLGRRNARNIQLVLARESRLDRVGDPGRGAYAIEARTDALARAAWDLMREIERDGGFSAALSTGRVDEELAAARDGLRREIGARRYPIVGISEYPIDEPFESPPQAPPFDDDAERAARREARGLVALGAIDAFEHAIDAAAAGATLDEIGRALVRGAPQALAALPEFREASVFEDLADAADRMDRRPRIFLACLGPLAAHGPRVAFATNLFRAGGLEVVTSEADAESADLAGAFAASGGSFACICGTDDAYEAHATGAIEALRSGGARSIWLARREMGGDEGLRDAGLDGYVFKGCDAARLLRELLELEGGVLDAEEVVL